MIAMMMVKNGQGEEGKFDRRGTTLVAQETAAPPREQGTSDQCRQLGGHADALL